MFRAVTAKLPAIAKNNKVEIYTSGESEAEFVDPESFTFFFLSCFVL